MYICMCIYIYIYIYISININFFVFILILFFMSAIFASSYVHMRQTPDLNSKTLNPFPKAPRTLVYVFLGGIMQGLLGFFEPQAALRVYRFMGFCLRIKGSFLL